MIVKNFQLFWALSVRYVKLRYRNSALGILWSLINPLIYLAVFSLVFSNVFVEIENYPAYAMCGIIIWNFFATTSVQVMTSLLDSQGILKTIAVDPLIFPFSALGASLFNFFLSLIPFFIILFGVLGFSFHPVMLLAPFYFLLFAIFTLGLGLILCSLNIYFRDVSIFWNSLMPVFFYSTPVVYPTTILSDKYYWILSINPLFHFLTIIRDIMYNGVVPSIRDTLLLFSLALLVFSIGIVIFKRLEKSFISNY